MSKSFSIMVALVSAGTVAACSGGASEGAQPATAEHVHAAGANADHASCPFGAPDVELALNDVEGGASLTATGPAERVEDLRTMGARMESMHESKARGHEMHRDHGGESGAGGMHGDREGGHEMHGGGHDGANKHGMHDGDDGAGEHGMHGGSMEHMPAANVAVEDIDGGVRLLITAASADHVESLRAHLREHVASMKDGKCAAMGEMGSQQAPEPPTGEHEH